MRCVERHTLREITGEDFTGKRASDLAYAVIDNGYPADALSAIADQAAALWQSGTHAQDGKYLRLDHIRGVQTRINEVATMMASPERLAALSEIAGTELEPYPIPPATSHINHYTPGAAPIDFHTDGAAFVELVPLEVTSPRGDGTTVVFRGTPEAGHARLARDGGFDESAVVELDQVVGRSVLLQGRMLLHSVRPLCRGSRTTLVLAMRSAVEPWKDGNTLARLLLDDDLHDVEKPWIDDQVHISNLFRQQIGLAS